MDWLDRMNNVMEYVETHLSDSINYDVVARIASLRSTYHFQRMFPFITNVSLSEYIRRRRLTLAAFELQTERHKGNRYCFKSMVTNLLRRFQSV